MQVKAFLGRPLDQACFPCFYLDATYLHGRLGQNMQVVSRAVVVAIGIFPNDAMIVRLLEQQEEWQLERRRFLSEAAMTKIPKPEQALALSDPNPFSKPDEPIS